MPDSIMYQEDCFLVLETELSEQFLSPEELLVKLKNILLNRQNHLPKELEKISSIDEQSLYLMNNYCELDVGENEYLQWYVVRLEK